MKKLFFIFLTSLALAIGALSVTLHVPKPNFPDSYIPSKSGEAVYPREPDSFTPPAQTPMPGSVPEDPVVSPAPGGSGGNAGGGCYRGGCSGQICSDQMDMVSTCEYREEYACYETAVCERQTSGECGWTETAELNMCLNDASQRSGDVRNIPF